MRNAADSAVRKVADTKEVSMAAVPPVCDFGWKAVDATLCPASTAGTTRSSSRRGREGLVVAFICNHCPYVKAVIDRIVRDAIELEAHGIGFVAISSNDAVAYPEDFLRQHEAVRAEARLRLPLSPRRGPGGGARLRRGLHAGLLRLQRASWSCSIAAGSTPRATSRPPPALKRELFEAMIEVSRTGRGPARADRLDRLLDQVEGRGMNERPLAARRTVRPRRHADRFAPRHPGSGQRIARRVASSGRSVSTR